MLKTFRLSGISKRFSKIQIFDLKKIYFFSFGGRNHETMEYHKNGNFFPRTTTLSRKYSNHSNIRKIEIINKGLIKITYCFRIYLNFENEIKNLLT